MKKLFTTFFLAIMALNGMAQMVGQEMYVFRNDGQVNGFLPEEVLSIEFSNTDAKGMKYSEMVTQVITTSDSVYMIPLAEIDSISFITPKTEYHEGVINLGTELLPYVVSCSYDPLSITLSSSTPSALMPKVGDLLATDVMNEKLPAGFLGKVTAIDGYTFFCKRTGLQDAFKNYRHVVSAYGYQDESDVSSSRRGIEAFGDNLFNLGTFNLPFSLETKEKVKSNPNCALTGGTSLNLSISPTVHVKSTLIVNNIEGLYISSFIKATINLTEQLSIYGNIEWSKDFLDKEFKFPVAPYTIFFFKPGIVVNTKAEITTSATWQQTFVVAATYDYSSKKRNTIKPDWGGKLESSSSEIEGCIDGCFGVGAFLEIGLAFIDSKIDNVCIRGELGAKLEGHAMLYNSDVDIAGNNTQVYDKFKNSNIELNAYTSTALKAEFLDTWEASFELPWNKTWNLNKWDYVPTITNTKLTQLNNPTSSADGYTLMTGNCLFPVKVGMSLFHQDGVKVESFQPEITFKSGQKELKHTFTGLVGKNGYKLYPTVRLFGVEMLASPSASLNIKEPKAETMFAEEVDETSALIKAQFQDVKGIVDSWGIEFWEGDNEEVKHIINFSKEGVVSEKLEKLTPHKTYYYQAFTKTGEEITRSEQIMSFFTMGSLCADENHPHLIDLGLPSGTKWACCNIGASQPHDWGDYIAWGETSDKGVNTWENYHFYDPTIYDLIYIGDDIAGSPYDVANVQWSGQWHMPTAEQLQELCSNCTQEFIPYQGRNGLLFTGQNGNKIFLPASGRRYEEKVDGLNAYGNYWGSTCTSLHEAVVLVFGAYGSLTNYYRDNGRSVRAVQSAQ